VVRDDAVLGRVPQQKRSALDLGVAQELLVRVRLGLRVRVEVRIAVRVRARAMG